MRILKCLILIFIVLFNASAMAEVGSLSWDAPITNEDGSPLTDLAGYKVYSGIVPGEYSQSVDVGNVLMTPTNLPDDGKTHYFAITAYDTSGNESKYSIEVSVTTEYIDTLCTASPINPVYKKGAVPE